jgi:signal transduction histidine kinase
MTAGTFTTTPGVGPWAALTRRFSPLLDVAVAVVATALAVTSLLITDASAIDPELHQPNAVAVAATAVSGLSLLWRRKRPTASFVAFVAGCLVVTLTGHYIGLLSLLLLLSLYSLAAHGRRRDGFLGLLSAMLTFPALALAGVPDLRTSDVLLAWALLVTSWAVGDAIRSRRAQQHDQVRAAEQEAAAAREHTGRAITEERLRIARELHDVVAHSMSLIAVQAGVGSHVIRTDVDAAEEALDVIAETSRQALSQTRSLLGMLRESDDPVGGPPTQRIGDLEAVVEGVRTAGVDVSLDVVGTPRSLDAAVELTAFRIVQESLTNVLKHAGSGRASVCVRYADDEIEVEIVNAGQRGPVQFPLGGSGGHGLIGLRERTHLVGGTLEYGASSDGFSVRAVLPTHILRDAS